MTEQVANNNNHCCGSGASGGGGGGGGIIVSAVSFFSLGFDHIVFLGKLGTTSLCGVWTWT